MKLIDELKRRLTYLEFELRYETDPVEKNHIADDRDDVKKQLAEMDCDADIDGKPSRGFICPKCGDVIGLDPAERCKRH